MIKIYSWALGILYPTKNVKLTIELIKKLPSKTIRKNKQFIHAILDYITRKKDSTKIQNDSLLRLLNGK